MLSSTMHHFDRKAKLDKALTANDLSLLFDRYWKYYGLEIPWLGNVQVMQRGIVDPHEKHRKNFYSRVMSFGGLEFGGNNAMASISYRLVERHETDFDLETHYTLDKTTAYKSRRVSTTGKFKMASARILNDQGAELLNLSTLYQQLDEETSSLSDWAKSNRPMFVACINTKCQGFQQSKIFDQVKVQNWALQRGPLENLEALLICSICHQKEHRLTAFPLKSGGSIITSRSRQ